MGSATVRQWLSQKYGTASAQFMKSGRIWGVTLVETFDWKFSSIASIVS
jgi:hypothetical protein